MRRAFTYPYFFYHLVKRIPTKKQTSTKAQTSTNEQTSPIEQNPTIEPNPIIEQISTNERTSTRAMDTIRHRGAADADIKAIDESRVNPLNGKEWPKG